jgi:hypothetical protein
VQASEDASRGGLLSTIRSSVKLVKFNPGEGDEPEESSLGDSSGADPPAPAPNVDSAAVEARKRAHAATVVSGSEASSVG